MKPSDNKKATTENQKIEVHNYSDEERERLKTKSISANGEIDTRVPNTERGSIEDDQLVEATLSDSEDDYDDEDDDDDEDDEDEDSLDRDSEE